MGGFIFPKSTKWRTFSIKNVKKLENVNFISNFIFKFILSSYIKNLLEIVVKLKIKKCWPSAPDDG